MTVCIKALSKEFTVFISETHIDGLTEADSEDDGLILADGDNEVDGDKDGEAEEDGESDADPIEIVVTSISTLYKFTSILPEPISAPTLRDSNA